MSAPISAALMVPSNNTTFEAEVLAWLPHGSTRTVARIPRGKGLLTRETLPAYTKSALDLAAQFAEPEIDVVIYGCTAAGFMSGPAGDAELSHTLGGITGKPVVTVADLASGLDDVGVGNDAVLTVQRGNQKREVKTRVIDLQDR